MPGEAMHAVHITDAKQEFWSRCLIVPEDFEADDIVFEVLSQDGPTYYVVAKSVEYAIRA
jgi:hypothetical protein